MLEALGVLLVLAQGGLDGLDAARVGLGVATVTVAPDLQGPYCAQINKCCPGRLDECSVPILGTLCYCDTFCNRTYNPDCCPDYFNHCHGYSGYEPFEGEETWTNRPPRPPGSLTAGCFFNGRHYPLAETIKFNCKDCKCVQMADKAEMLCSEETCLIDTKVLEWVNRDQGRDADGGKGAGRGGGGGFGGSEGWPTKGPPRSRWTAYNYTQFWGRTLKDGISLRLGTLQPSEAVLSMTPLRHPPEPPSLPASFDARSTWPGQLSAVQDQGWCGASWALSTAAVASDRYAIMSLGREAPRLAAQHLLDCNNRKQHGCNGGHLDRAWYFTRKFGLVPDACYPWTGRNDTCHVPKKATLQTARCPLRAVTSRKAKTELYRMGPAYRLDSEQDIMREIIKSGPVQATMQVFHDLFTYRSGIYEHVPIEEMERSGFHSVRIIGWGEEEGVKYWLVANSWGEWWGEGGFFRIRRGVNECQIEHLVLAAWAHTHNAITV
ncbi:tubulointerstitial nephritis antigen-like [Thrips palmi]|uniref:Tubulointerstitial nephritis antigen-like n=1 Tax=Thrips palmi TaxID=161013 RepID=A0A6P8ZY21_THRPL|nr:tubulointerstitial nephritis antigen-like [Thrips palmi]